MVFLQSGKVPWWGLGRRGKALGWLQPWEGIREDLQTKRFQLGTRNMRSALQLSCTASQMLGCPS